MQNIIYVYYEFGKNEVDKVSYSDIFDKNNPFRNIQQGAYLNFVITSYKESLFGIEPDIYCIYKNSSFLFSLSPICLKSEEITDFNILRLELISYLRIYFDIKFKLIKTPEDEIRFYFKHNLVDNINLKKYKKCSWIVQTVNFYIKYCKSYLWCVDLYNENVLQENNKLNLLDDFIKTLVSMDLNKRVEFFLCSLNFLPLDLILNVLKLVIPKEVKKKIFFFYKLSNNMIYRKKYNLGYIYLLQIVIELRNTLDIQLAEYFFEQTRAILKRDRWKKILDDIHKTLELENIKSLGNSVWEENVSDRTNLELENLKVMTGNFILKGLFPSQNSKTSLMNLKRDESLIVDYLDIEFVSKVETELQEIQLVYERIVKGSIEKLGAFKIPIFTLIFKGKNNLSIFIDLEKHLKDLEILFSTIDQNDLYLKIERIIFKEHLPIYPTVKPFRIIQRKNKLLINEVFKDSDCDIFTVKNKEECKIFTQNLFKIKNEWFIIFETGKEKVLYYEISEGYLEKFVFD